jgi:hypothetical protein
MEPIKLIALDFAALTKNFSVRQEGRHGGLPEPRILSREKLTQSQPGAWRGGRLSMAWQLSEIMSFFLPKWTIAAIYDVMFSTIGYP